MAKKVERENSFGIKQKKYLKYWDFDKNTLDPYKISDGSHQKAWFVCDTCGESYQRGVRDFLRCLNKVCPKCKPNVPPSGTSFAEKYPELLNDWDYKKNIDEDPYQIPYSSHKKIFWECSNKHSYIMTPNRKSSYRQGCPFCSNQKVLPGFNDLLSQDPILAEQWDYDKNDFAPNQITKSSGKKVWWICPHCKKSYQSSPNTRQDGIGCPHCNRTSSSFAEQFILNSLRVVFGEDKVLSRDKTVIGKELDIFIPNLNFAIEPGDFDFHRSENVLLADRKKKALCKKNNIQLLTITFNYKYSSFRGLSWKVKTKLSAKHKKELLNIVYRIFSLLDITYSFSEKEIDNVVKKSYLSSRSITTDEFINKLSTIDNSIKILGDYISNHTKITAECKRCGTIWHPAPHNLLQGHGCPECSKPTKPVLCLDTGESFFSLKEAGNKVNRPPTCIYQAIKKNGTCAGYKWKYITKEEYNELYRQ